MSGEHHSGIIIEDLPDEVWKPLEECAGYFVSDQGRVYRQHSNGNRYLVHVHVFGHSRIVVLSHHQQRRTLPISFLVAKYFLGERGDRKIVHRDDDYDNNCASNLVYTTAEEYSEWLHQRAVRRGHTKGATEQRIRQMKREAHLRWRSEVVSEVRAGHMTLREAGSLLGITESGVCRWMSNHPEVGVALQSIGS